MPKRQDLKKILIIGSGPIVIGQACEFDYSGNQGVKALKEEGYDIVLLNSNPATIMTDPDLVAATYIEPMTLEVLEKILVEEKPDALLPTLGGQTALNLAVDAHGKGLLEKYNVELIGAQVDAIKKAEDRYLFKQAMQKIGIEMAHSRLAHTFEEAMEAVGEIGFPAIIRPAFTLGGTGGGIAYNMEDYKKLVQTGLDLSPNSQILVEESIIGWKEFELEVMRDQADNVVIICSIENIDPMGIHTGDSITVAPAQTLSDKEYQLLRDAAIKIIREIGVDTGGSNVQFAINPENGKIYAIEMNPRVSRSSALASKATGFPIAKIAAKLAVGYCLDEILNDITQYTPASFEPTIDYVVTKLPRFAFEKFKKSDATLTTQMKSVGEVMSMGRTFKESFNKALRSLENDRCGLTPIVFKSSLDEKELEAVRELVEEKLRIPNADRIWYVGDAFRLGLSVEEVFDLTHIDPWFLAQIEEIIDLEKCIKQKSEKEKSEIDLPTLKLAKEYGFSDSYLASLLGLQETDLRNRRKLNSLVPVYKTVDTCAAEFEAYTPYFYSTYEKENESIPSDKKKVVILGGGPNRIGQGIEFDYCCVHAAQILSELGYESIMVNCNPETVSTDYDTSDRLYFEALTAEDVLNILDHEKPDGIIVQYGGQTPLKLTEAIESEGYKILGTSVDSIDLAEDRKRFHQLLETLKLRATPGATATSLEQAIKIAEDVGYPVMVRPSYVLGGRAMEIVYDQNGLKTYMKEAVEVSFDHPVLVDRFLERAIEVDVDCVSDGQNVVVGGIMEHIEEAGVHSGDSACCLPPYSLSQDIVDKIIEQSHRLAKGLKVIGLMNVQFAVQKDSIFVIEVNPRASRTVPFVSKAIGKPLAKIGVKAMLGISLNEQGFTKQIIPDYLSVKEAALPFIKFPGEDTLLGPEMKSTGEVMGIDADFGMAFAKAQFATGNVLPQSGTVFLSVRNEDKESILSVAQKLIAMQFEVVATRGTAAFLAENNVAVTVINKVKEGSPHNVDMIKNKKIHMVINTPLGKKSAIDSYEIRRAALEFGVPYFTTVAAAKAAVEGIQDLKDKGLRISSLQSYHRSSKLA